MLSEPFDEVSSCPHHFILFAGSEIYPRPWYIPPAYVVTPCGVSWREAVIGPYYAVLFIFTVMCPQASRVLQERIISGACLSKPRLGSWTVCYSGRSGNHRTGDPIQRHTPPTIIDNPPVPHRGLQHHFTLLKISLGVDCCPYSMNHRCTPPHGFARYLKKHCVNYYHWLPRLGSSDSQNHSVLSQFNAHMFTVASYVLNDCL